MASTATPSRSSSVPIKRSRLDLSPRALGTAKDDTVPLYIKVVIGMLIDSEKKIAELSRSVP
ncbi:hypothetical protein TELCIR_06703 [Teladorsagia circumcincta]|uniref:Uncharacterized protein n=1 Tax=Teladorsagia circumcincta TaxID=45464 RepID=A0A2G9UNW1_TELCI|nr:hypothetical protein TELCIR_06703 [Teladorsagia circumcincta]